MLLETPLEGEKKNKSKSAIMYYDQILGREREETGLSSRFLEYIYHIQKLSALNDSTTLWVELWQL